MNKFENKICERVLPVSTIRLAVNGDTKAVRDVLSFYERYINKLSCHMTYDEQGNQNYMIDEDMRRRLETKLIIKILAFRID